MNIGLKLEVVKTALAAMSDSAWWSCVYKRLVNDMHLHPETKNEMNQRLGDNRSGWLKRADHATIA